MSKKTYQIDENFLDDVLEKPNKLDEKEQDFDDLMEEIQREIDDDSDEKDEFEEFEEYPEEEDVEDEEPDYDAEMAMDRQMGYEEEIKELGYDEDTPYWKFRHNFMRSQYLPVKVIKSKKSVYEDITDEELAMVMLNQAYYQSSRGVPKLNHIAFCELWHDYRPYVYAGVMLTPNGQIDMEMFKSEVTHVLFRMNSERQNLNVLAANIISTYISAYKINAYDMPYLIPFRNGDLELNEDGKGFTFYEGRKTSVPYRFEYDFKNIPNVLEPVFPNFRKWRDDLFEDEDVFSLKQMLGYLLLPINTAQEAFFIIGKAGSGKSILTDTIIPKMLGNACFPMSIGQFFNDKFQKATSEGKLCMIDDDIGEARFSYEDSGRFKNFVTAETIQIEHKYCMPVRVNNSARIVCAGNHMIKSADKTDGFTRRLHPIYIKPRDTKDIDVTLPNKIKDEIEMIVLWALEGLLDVIANKGFPYRSGKTNSNFLYYAEGQKWEEQFIRDCFEIGQDCVTYSTDIRDILNDWLKDNSEIAGEGTLTKKFSEVSHWLREEGADKYGYIYKRGLKKGTNYNARGYVGMKKKDVSEKTTKLYTDEHGRTMLKISRVKKPDPLDEAGE